MSHKLCNSFHTSALAVTGFFFSAKRLAGLFFFSFHSRRGEFTHEKSLEASLRISLVIL